MYFVFVFLLHHCFYQPILSHRHFQVRLVVFASAVLLNEKYPRFLFLFFTIVASDAFGVVLRLTVDFVEVRGAIFHCITRSIVLLWQSLEILDDWLPV